MVLDDRDHLVFQWTVPPSFLNYNNAPITVPARVRLAALRLASRAQRCTMSLPGATDLNAKVYRGDGYAQIRVVGSTPTVATRDLAAGDRVLVSMKLVRQDLNITVRPTGDRL